MTPAPDDVAGLRVLFVMATQQEYGPHLRARIRPLITGVGPVEAAAATAAALATLANSGALPDLLFSLGSAGSRDLEHAGIYQVASVTYRDMDCSALGFERGVTPFLDEPAIIEIAHRIPGVASATLSSGARIMSGRDYDTLGAEMADMESFSVLRAARRFGVPFVGLRGISDGRSELTGLHDWTEYLHEIDEKLAAMLDRFEQEVGRGGFALTQRGDSASQRIARSR